MTSSPTIVLLHGAGTGPWIWDRVQLALSAPAVALELAARRPGATPDAVAEAIVTELDRRGIESVILVLHSLAGVLASGFRARLGARLQRIVYVAAVVPPPDGTFLDTLSFVPRTLLRILFALNRKGLKPSESMIRQNLCNDLTAEDADRVVARYEAEWPGLYLNSVGAPPAIPGSLYVKLTADQSVTPAQQDAIAARLPDCRIETLKAGHLAMLSQPEAVAECIASSVS